MMHSTRMRETGLRIVFGLLILGLTLTGFCQEPENRVIDFDATHWNLDPNTTIAELAGRRALTGAAYLKDVEFLNGTIEVDVYTEGERGFGGFMFRVQSFEEYEWYWLRTHKTNGAPIAFSTPWIQGDTPKFKAHENTREPARDENQGWCRRH